MNKKFIFFAVSTGLASFVVVTAFVLYSPAASVLTKHSSLKRGTPSFQQAESLSSSELRTYRVLLKGVPSKDPLSVELHAFDSEGRHTGPLSNPIPGSDLILYDKEILNSTYLGPNNIALNVENGPYQIKLKFSSTATITLKVTETLSDFDKGIINREVNEWEFVNILGEPGCTLAFSLGRTLKDSIPPQTECPN